MSLIAPILKFPNVFINLYDMTLPDFEIYNGLLTVVGGSQAYLRSGFMAPRSMTPACVDVLTKYMTNPPSPSSLLVWSHMGGKISENPPDKNSFAYRDARFLYEVKAIWKASDQIQQNVDWAYQLGEEMKPHTTGAYVNYIDPLLVDWPKEFYRDNYDRLVSIKEQVDPKNRFHFQQSVGSPFRPKPGSPPDLSPLFRTFID
jgi:hypothetical protein